ncbi:ribonuclease R [Erysipelothrix sp. HDW6C]|uniref:ribonuclease R n=1 Tax=Erysipelothrix sp. HDW6C TaxID=2714930 RepID=UPI00140C7485|nr:ribonuclease R [Erysipelothrix sp. HDW6C]QIK69342.1 ribonuclease R [Erysipelothrix sp. HDW6C]
MKNYEVVRDEISQTKELQSLEAWIENFKTTIGLSAADFKKIIQRMIDEEEVVVHKEKVYFLDNKRFARGTFRVVRDTFGFVENDHVSIYIAGLDYNGSLDLDDVLVEIKSAEKQYGVIVTTLKRNRDVLLGTMKMRGKGLFFIPYDTKITLQVEYEKGNLSLKENDRVIGKILNVGDKIDVEITSVLGQADEPGMDVRSVLFVYGIDVEFPEEVLEEVKSVPSEVSEKETEGRMDHRDQYVITIDGEDAKDLDDAIYMESLANGFRLYVHIADVAHYVKQDSAIGKSAFERSSSVYMVDRVVPMLPKELSNGVCSLHPNVDRLVMTAQIDIGFNGEIIDYNIYQSVIHSKRRMSYIEVNSGEDLKEVQPMIDMMRECASRLKYKREQAGSIGFESDESKFIIDNDGNVLDIFKRETGEAEEMIEMFMVTANEVVARHARYQFIPILYRIHDHPTKEKMQDLSHTLRILGYRMKGNLEEIRPKSLQKALEFFEGKPEYPVVSKLMLRSMSKAKYSPEPIGHFGLALEDYAHFTSPIRRYPDLLLHQRLKKYVVKQDRRNVEKDEAFTEEAGIHASKKERSILDAERQVEKIKKAQFMQDKVGETFIGYISGVTNFGIFVELPNTVEGLIHVRTLNDDFYQYDAMAQKMIGERTKQVYSIGQKLKVKLVSVDKIEHVVNFEIIKPRTRKGRRVIHERRRKKS